MADSFYFYDLETSGIDARSARIMQFAGQRTDLDLNPIGESQNIIIALSEDILPDPDAILVTGITPQFTISEGTTEADFLQTFESEIAIPGTIFVGYNTVRFDDEFMRSILYRNFYDPYQWQYKDDRSRWDLLDVVRMTRALRLDGISWPVDDNGNPTNRLELLTKLNGLDHSKAHDALNDVLATIALAKLIRTKQPKLFDYLLSVRDKKSVRALVGSGKPIVYSSGKYPNEFQKTTVVQLLVENPRADSALVYDLRHDPSEFFTMSVDQLVQAWQWQKPDDRTPDNPRLPIKTLKYNRCPAVAPVAVLDGDSQTRLGIDMKIIEQNRIKLSQSPYWKKNVLLALEIMDAKQSERFVDRDTHVDAQIYEGFMTDGDSRIMAQIRRSDPDQIMSYIDKCRDTRLKQLLPLYKARNFPRKLSDEERKNWEVYKHDYLQSNGEQSRIAKYFARIQELSKKPDLTESQKFILEELNLYGQSLIEYEA